MVFNYEENVSETVSLADSLAGMVATSGAVNESVTLQELIEASLGIDMPLIESAMLMSDNAEPIYSAIVDLSDGAAIAGQLDAQLHSIESVSEDVPWAEHVEDDRGDSIVVDDSVGAVSGEVTAKTSGLVRVVVLVDNAIVARVGLMGEPVAVYVNNKIRVQARLSDMTGAPFDPTGARLVVERPGATPLTFGSKQSIGNGVVRSSAGVYFAELTPQVAGKYKFAWFVTADDGTADSYTEGEFSVKERKVSD